MQSIARTIRWSFIFLTALLWIGWLAAPGARATVSNAKEPTLEELAIAARVVPLPLLSCEKRLLQKAPKGDVAYCGPKGKQLSDSANDPESGDRWGSDREIRADLIAWLCTDPRASKLVDPSGIQVQAAKISGALDLSFVATHFALWFYRCRFLKSLALRGADLVSVDLEGSRTEAIVADSVKVNVGIFLRNEFHAKGEVNLANASVAGELDCDGGHFDNPAGMALNADGIKIGGYIFLRNGFKASGEVKLLNATIGNLECDGGHFDSSTRPALNADGINAHAIFLRKGFEAKGGVRLVSANIGVDLDCHGGHFDDPNGIALNANGIKTGGHVFLSKGFDANGEVNLANATVGGNLDCDGGTFINRNLDALNAEGLKVRSVFLGRGFHADGKVWLSVAEIGNNLDLRHAELAHTSIHAEATTVKGAFFYKEIADGPPIILDLSATSVGELYDDLDSLNHRNLPSIDDWPRDGNLDLDGFAYSYLNNPSTASRRLEWLEFQLPADEGKRHGYFRPQPYKQLAKALNDKGLDADARQVLIGMENDRRMYADLTWSDWVWAWILRLTVGYGYRPLQVVPWLATFWICGAVLFRYGYKKNVIAPTDRDAYEKLTAPGTLFGCREPFSGEAYVNVRAPGSLPAYYEPFSAAIYSLDVLLPIIELGQRKCWAPTLPANPTERQKRLYVIAWWYRLASLLVGWFIATMLAIGIGSLITK